MEVLLYTILTLCVLGILSAVILYVVAQKFRVEEDPRIDEVEKMLPGANCGGCGFAGCRGMADALVKQDDISSLFCPVGGGDTMKAVAAYLGKAAPEKEPQVATVRCGGTCEKRPRTNEYNGARSCAVASSLYIGETGCAFGCLGYGDCVAACAFGAITIDPATGLPVVDPDKCTACGACVKACPKKIIELRKKWPKNRAVYVSCVSKDKGAVVMKACKAGCIGCGKCEKVCAFGAITVENNLAYIDPQKCKLCRKCVNECPTGAIRLVGMDPLPYYYEPDLSPRIPEKTAEDLELKRNPLVPEELDAKWHERDLPHEEIMEKYPFIMSTGHRRYSSFHSEHRQVAVLRELDPNPMIEINPADAERIGVSDGQWCEISNMFGSAKFKARVMPTVGEGHVEVDHGWWFPEEDGSEPNLYGTFRSQINNLCPNGRMGKLGFGAPNKCLICNVEPVSESYDTDMNLIWEKFGKLV